MYSMYRYAGGPMLLPPNMAELRTVSERAEMTPFFGTKCVNNRSFFSSHNSCSLSSKFCFQLINSRYSVFLNFKFIFHFRFEKHGYTFQQTLKR
jgi:hypothetical protein